MAHIFRLHPNGANINPDWQQCQPYSTNVISQIVPPNGMTAKTEITSIPSPFARIALVKSAFGQASSDLDGNTIYHKMVSDSLDVAEIFFNYDRLGKMFQILVWDVNADMAAMAQTHSEIYNTLDVYLKQDAATYNFDRMKRLYVLVYVGEGRKTQMDVVGATSPASLFFTPANDLSYISPHISFGQDHPFDGSFQPLYKRDPSFIEYLFAFSKRYGQFANDFPEVHNYLNETFKKLPQQMKNNVSNLTATAVNNYLPLQLDAANTVDILGMPYHKKPVQPIRKSDFIIAHSHYNSNIQPLVLPVDSGNKYAGMYYIVDKWGANKAPYYDNTQWLQRVLPQDGTPHPYLTISDFLEDTILFYPRKANTGKFFFGNWDVSNEASVMLPLKPLFFEFFTVDQLIKGINGVPMLTMSRINTNGIEVHLNIPIAGGSVEYTRNYYHNAVPDADQNRGSINTISTSFGLAMMPMVHCNNPFDRIAITHVFNDPHQYKLDCYYDGKVINGIQEVVRNQTDKAYLKTHIFINEKGPIDYIRIGVGTVYGVVVPDYNQAQKNKNYTFAVDFGTTNTHIEYTDGSFAASDFKDCQLTFWADYHAQIVQAFEADLEPFEIGDRFKFPTRTALSEASFTNWKQPVIPMAQTNVPLIYGHRPIFDFNTITTDLKWSNDPDNISKVRSYIENLMIMMRNKVLLEGGNLDNTKIIWFYPGSMTTARRNQYQTVWQDAFIKYFGAPQTNISATLESVAPYEYFRRQSAAASRMVSIDIGGGTTDVVIAERGNILYTTSFRFAANSIFGDGYTQNNVINGLVANFVDDIEEKLGSNSLDDLKDILQSLKAKGVSADLASFFFSMKNDDKAIERNAFHLLDWNKMLQQDDKYKVVFLLFYTAIIYHIAHIMKGKELEMPRHIAFSGNGARVVSVLSPSTDTLADYTMDVFCRVYGINQYHQDGLDVILIDNPKAATCKGGINIVQNNNVNIGIGQKVLLKSHKDKSFFTQDSTYSEVNTLKQITIDDVRNFISFVLEGKTRFSVKDEFGISQVGIDTAKIICYRDLDTFFDNGMQEKLKENSVTDPIEEPLFFYPIIGMLHELCNNL